MKNKLTVAFGQMKKQGSYCLSFHCCLYFSQFAFRINSLEHWRDHQPVSFMNMDGIYHQGFSDLAPVVVDQENWQYPS